MPSLLNIKRSIKIYKEIHEVPIKKAYNLKQNTDAKSHLSSFAGVTNTKKNLWR